MDDSNQTVGDSSCRRFFASKLAPTGSQYRELLGDGVGRLSAPRPIPPFDLINGCVGFLQDRGILPARSIQPIKEGMAHLPIGFAKEDAAIGFEQGVE